MTIQSEKYRLLIVLLIIVITPMGFFTKYYDGPAASWVANSLGGLIYEVFWCLVVALLLPRSRPFNIAVSVFLATCLLEFMQLWHPPFLEWLRASFIGRTILGSSFNWLDFPYYALGCAAGWYMLELMGRVSKAKGQTSGQP